ncbi:MAG: hypothetical protein FWE68_06620, partial [Defluviitaleaceae bacterium]|nr:hypothetical protein [Defluviitaleaceae bacterium]
MIEKMRRFNITGPMDDLDRVLDEYLSDYDIQLEDAVSELKHAPLKSFRLPNPYTEILRTAENLISVIGGGAAPESLPPLMTAQAVETINAAEKLFEERAEHIKELNTRLDKYRGHLEVIGHFTGLKTEIEKFRLFKFIGCRFGHMPYSSFRQLELFLYDEPDILYIECERTKENVWAVYFAPDESKERIDAIFSSLHFERTDIPEALDGEELSGTPAELYARIQKRISETEAQILSHHQTGFEEINITAELIWAAYLLVKDLSYHCDARKFAGRSDKGFYIFVGWISERDALALQERVCDDENVMLIIAEDSGAFESDALPPPTKLKNNPLFRPFELFVRMYGLPAYGEIDPTPFVAVTYMLLFGLMFGDLGHGAVLAAIGIYIYKVKKLQLGAIMALIGASGMVFGILYGSVFGMEDFIPALWMRPTHSINQILIVTVGLGIGLIVGAMLLNMYNLFRKRDWQGLLISPNGLSGLVFYGVLVFAVGTMFAGVDTGIPGSVIAAFAAAPLIIMALHKLIVEWRQPHPGKSVPLLIFETIIEMFEVLL